MFALDLNVVIRQGRAMKLRITEQEWQTLCKELLSRDDVETAGVLLGEPIQTSKGIIVLVRKAIAIPDDGYIVRKPDQLSIDPVILNRLTKLARDKQWSVFTIHTHPGADEAWFSKADDNGDSRLMPSLHCQIPYATHGSIVLASSGKFIVRAFDADGVSTEVPMQVIGNSITTSQASLRNKEQWFSRQELALGKAGQSKLRNLRVGVVGLGGIGSLVSMQLSHLGVGEMVLIDGDTVESSNLSRIVGAKKCDVGETVKVAVAARYAEALGLIGKVESFAEYLSDDHESLIASCDVVVSCVDTHSARALLNRFSYKYHVPVIDLGTVFRVDGTGLMVSDAGRVVTIGPGRPCLACWGHIDPNAIRIESMSRDDLENEINEGYVEGANVVQPSVISFNTYVAGSGVTELLRLVTEFSGAESPPNRLAFSFRDGVVRRNALAGNHRCTICSHQA